jgi:hypothetical protein
MVLSVAGTFANMLATLVHGAVSAGTFADMLATSVHGAVSGRYTC